MRYAICLSDLGTGGTQRLALGLAEHLLDQGHGVQILTLDSPGAGSAFPLPAGVEVRGLGLLADSRGLLGALSANRDRVAALRRTLRDLGAEAVISFLTTTNVLALLAAQPLGLPVIVTEESDPGHEPLPRPWALLRRLTYGRARHIVVHARGAAAFFRAGLARRVRVIPNPVPPCPAGADAGRSRPPVVVAMGRLSPEKGFDLLIAAFGQIAAQLPQWSLRILGDGPLRPALVAQAAALGLADRIALPGFSAHPAQTFAAASLFCSAARLEGFGIALCEAMACGLPVVATDAPSGPRDIVRPGIDGDLVPVNDVHALADALAALMADPRRRTAYGARAREVAERFAPARVWAAWDAVLAPAGAAAP